MKLFELFEDRDNLLSKLNRIAIDLGISMVVIGGVAVAQYGYVRNTKDIDLMMSMDDAMKFGNYLNNHNEFEFIGNNSFKHLSSIDVNLCPEGVKMPHGESFRAPDDKTPGIQIISLPDLLAMKVKAKRMKDRADFVELVKINQIDKKWIGDHLKLSDSDQRWAIALFEKAMREQV